MNQLYTSHIQSHA